MGWGSNHWAAEPDEILYISRQNLTQSASSDDKRPATWGCLPAHPTSHTRNSAQGAAAATVWIERKWHLDWGRDSLGHKSRPKGTYYIMLIYAQVHLYIVYMHLHVCLVTRTTLINIHCMTYDKLYFISIPRRLSNRLLVCHEFTEHQLQIILNLTYLLPY